MMDTPPPGFSDRADPSQSPPPPSSPAVFSPISEESRHRLIDALRGFAIFGILLVNMGGFKAPMLAAAGTGQRSLAGGLNWATSLLIEILASGKFIAIFALLFGMGMAIQAQRARRAGRKFTPFFLRRMSVLFLLGVVHGIFLWAGDILAVYALFGMAGLLFLKCRPRTLLVWSAVIFGWVLAVFMGLGTLVALDDGSGDIWWTNLGKWWVEAYQGGSFGEIVVARLAEWGLMWGVGLFTFLPYAFSLFLVGMALGKIDVLARLDLWRPKLRLFVAFALPAGLASSLLYAAVFNGAVAGGMGSFALGMGSYLVGMLLLALAYIVSFSFLVRSGFAPALVDRLAAVGRLALTNYLIHSLVANVLFMSWGFGLYGKLEAQKGVLIVLAVFGIQLLVAPPLRRAPSARGV